jgi:hypothetical protein
MYGAMAMASFKWRYSRKSKRNEIATFSIKLRLILKQRPILTACIQN